MVKELLELEARLDNLVLEVAEALLDPQILHRVELLTLEDYMAVAVAVTA
jgi:hypothetical protein